MAAQNDVILNTEMVLESCRTRLSEFKKNASHPLCCTTLENLLFQIIVFFYTHRTVWASNEFWEEYAQSPHSDQFSQHAYNEMIKITLITLYTHLCFCIEGAFCAYLSNNSQENVVKLFKKLILILFKMMK
ncbi:hypothetical protein [Legionella tunisiensis]|uniref:hypothetical protein n=1 Tax=Legionella tunisiensis TaxID=1034944 RepID=UPI0003689C50|nr:hypothetical protein [Legionella tunisiensis]